MFDRKLIEGFATDLDLNDVLLTACAGAADLMKRAADSRRHAYISRSSTGEIYYFLDTEETKALRMMAHAIMTPYRASFEMRTEMERSQADAMVRVGAARFLAPACAGETCDDCDRPIWQHIQKWGTVSMCPFGREYWALARAIFFEAKHTRTPGIEMGVIRQIARRSPA